MICFQTTARAAPLQGLVSYRPETPMGTPQLLVVLADGHFQTKSGSSELPRRKWPKTNWPCDRADEEGILGLQALPDPNDAVHQRQW